MTRVSGGQVVRQHNLMETINDLIVRSIGLTAFYLSGFDRMVYSPSDNAVMLALKTGATVAAIDELRFILAKWGVRLQVIPATW